ncbi:MAG: acetate--CoA ligase family protein [Actinomycetota bacterium]|nr:acetate--CoA ligase family protein [Actinomycetota bacterium]
MLEARSVAVVGASSREGSFGSEMLGVLQEGSFGGDVYPVNPRYSEIAGLACYESLSALPAPADLVLLGVPDQALEDQLQAAASCGAGSAVIFSSCYEEPSPDRPPLAARLADIASAAGMALCGNNCMGFVNLEHSLRACGYRLPTDLEAGGISFISHSGSAFSALLYNRRRLRFNLVVSSGQELVTGAPDYLAYALERPSTTAVALLLETVRSPEAFLSCLREAQAKDIPVVVCKVGRHERSKALVTAHSGALAGDDGAYEAVFDAFGVLRVNSLDEMADTLELLVSGRRAGRGGIATVHDSGGERALVADVAHERGVGFAPLQPETVARLESVLEPGLVTANPLDAWGSGNNYEAIFSESLKALLDDDNVAAVALCVDLTAESRPEGGYVAVLKEAWAHSRKPLALLSNLSSAIEPSDAASLRAADIPVLEGTHSGIAALAHLLALRDHRALPDLSQHAPPDTEVRRAWRARLRSEVLDEVSGLELLRAYGIRAAAARRAGSSAEAIGAAAEIGYPVALKTAAPDVAHKVQLAGVRLGLRSETELMAAYDELSSRLGPLVTIAEMVAPGVELALGIVRDPQFGPLLVVAAGGVLVEVLGDRALALPPIDEVRALRLLERLKPYRVLSREGADMGSLARGIAALSTLALDLPPEVAALDINPVIAHEDGCVAVDVLVEHERSAGRSRQ